MSRADLAITRPGLAAALALILVAMISAGCGTSRQDERLSKSAYEKQLQLTAGRAQIAVVKFGFAISRAPTAALIELRLRRLQKVLDEASQNLEKLRPPKEAEAENRDLAQGFGDLREYVAKLGADQPGGLRPLSTFYDDLQASPGAKRVRETLSKLEAKGYDIAPPR